LLRRSCSALQRRQRPPLRRRQQSGWHQRVRRAQLWQLLVPGRPRPHHRSAVRRMRHLASLAALTLLCGGCDYTVLSTEVGEHVVYHYDADANQMCGATVATADRFVEMIPAHYGLPHATNGPNIEYFWEVDGLIRNACPRDKRACVWFLLSGFTVFSGDPLCAHELAHTARGGHGLPPLINETFAWRWESALLSPNAPPNTELSFVNEAELRDHLERSSSDADVLRGFTWLIALEITYGPEKHGEFITELGESASAKDVEAAVQRVFGLSLAESVTLAASQPTLTVAEPACKLQGLPTLVWDGEPLVIDLEGARC